MAEEVVVGLDSSTQSTKAIAWTREGVVVAEGRAAVQLFNPSAGRFEQDVEDIWSSSVRALSQLCEQIDAHRIVGLSVSNQRETAVFLDEAGRGHYPVLNWLDERARAQVAQATSQIPAERLHAISGRWPHAVCTMYRMMWVREHAPDVFARTACFADVQTLLVERLTGERRTGWISADPTGMVAMERACWSEEILRVVGIESSRLPQLFAPGALLGEVTSVAAEVTGLLPGTRVFAAGGDGQCAGLGTNCTTEGRAYINLGTAVVSGVWSERYAVHPAWRTELAAQGHGYIFETVMLAGAFMVRWFAENFCRGQAGAIEALTSKAAEIPIGSEGLLFLPYLSGVMMPHWDARMRGVLVGLTASHKLEHLYRATIEGLLLGTSESVALMEQHSGLAITEFLAIGGGAHNPLWRQGLADATGRVVRIADTIEASSLGAAMLAAYGAGWYASIEEAAAAMAGESQPIHPNEKNGARYRELLDIYKDVYGANRRLCHRLEDFSS